MNLNEYKIIPKLETVQRLQMTDEQYFGSGLPGYISNSKLSLLNPAQGGSYEKFIAGLDDSSMNKNSLELGSAVHALFLEKDVYRLSDYTKPSGKVGPIVEDVAKHILDNMFVEHNQDELYHTYGIKNDYYANSLTPNRIKSLRQKGDRYLEWLLNREAPVDGKKEIVLSEDLNRKCATMIASLGRDSTINNMFFPDVDNWVFDVKSYYEDVITIEVDVQLSADVLVPLKLKGKIDQWSIDQDNKLLLVNDLKTTGKEIKYFAGYGYKDFNTQEDKFVNGSFQSFHYYRQVAMYSWMIWQYAKRKYNIDRTWNVNSNIAIVESTGDHSTSLMPVTRNWVQKGFKEFEDLIKTLAYYTYYGDDVRRQVGDL